MNVATTSSHVYGSDGFRHRGTSAGITTDYLLDGQNVVRELRGGVTYATYLTGGRGPAYRRDSAGAVRWYLYDGLGSVLGEVDPNGTVTETRVYDVYGASRTTTGTGTSKHRFVGILGHPSEDESGLIYMRARYYDPTVGRFVSEDPAAEGLNWFAYADNSPSNAFDSSGKGVEWSCFWVALGMAFVAAGLAAGVLGPVAILRDALVKGSCCMTIGCTTVAAFCFGMAAIGLQGNATMYAALLRNLTTLPLGIALIALTSNLAPLSQLGLARVALVGAEIQGLIILGVCASIGVDA